MNYSFHTLEFDKVIPILEKHLKTYTGKKSFNTIKPFTDPESLRDELETVKQMTEYLKFDGSLSFEETEEIGTSLKNAGIEGFILGIDEILEIKKTMEVWISNSNSLRAISTADHIIKYPKLLNMIELVPIPADLVKRLGRIIDNNGNIFDNASEELKRIRKRKSSVRQDIQNKLNTVMDRENMRGVIRDRIITVRDGRFVIPVRSQFKNKVRSELNYIVHSFSGSGETSYVEPQEVLYLNNELVEIDELELIEIRKILRAVTSEIGNQAADINILSEALGILEFIYARAKFAVEFKCGFPEIIDGPASFKLIDAYHPLLGKIAVPISIETGFSYQGIIISGPNAGGKTVALKTAGLLLMMVLCGIPIPAHSDSKIGIFTGIMAEIGDEQSISENLSSFSGHIKNIALILSQCGSGSLVLIDELASSTEPKEGEALGREIIRYLLEKDAKFIITTHYQGIKEFAYNDNRIRNAFVEFDEEKLIPLYKLHMGGTGSSFALKAAIQYGLPGSVITGAEDYLNSNYSDTDKLLKNLEQEKNLLYKQKEIVADQIMKARTIKDEYDKILKEITEEKKIMDRKGVGLLRKELDDALKELSQLKKEMRQKGDKDIKNIDNRMEDIREVLKSAEVEILKDEKKHPPELKAGQTVYVGSLRKMGYIEESSGDKVKVRLGIISAIVDKDDLYQPNEETVSQEKKTYRTSIEINAAPFLIDIRGKSYEEALKIVEKSLDSAVAGGMQTMHIIHGKGEGILRKAVWDYLKHQNFVKSYQFARPEEGGQGKTIVILK